MPTDPSRTSEQRLRAAVESSPSGILMTDGAGRIVLANREVERLFGYPREELLGRPVEMLVPERFSERHPGYRGGFMGDPRVRAMGAGRDLFGRRKDGSEVPVEIGLTPVATEEGLFVLASIVDISARHTAEADRRRLEHELQQAQKLEVVGTMASGIAHDFNNILGAIVGYAEMLRPRLTDPQAAIDLDRLLTAAMRGKRVIERVTTFSRRQEIKRGALDMVATVEEAMSLMRATLPAGIELRLEAAGGLPNANADATAIHQVLLNLATNSAHAMPDGGRISISLESFYLRDSAARVHAHLREGPYVLLSVRDTGGGMPREVVERAFEPFYTTKPPGEGSGLGLAMVQGLIREHGGSVEIESEPGRGTLVRCYFPAVATEAPAAAVQRGRTPHGTGQGVLYVDDEPTLAELGQRRLEDLGYSVTAVTDPEEALKRLGRDPGAFAILITDYSMPRMNGVGLARQAREILPSLRVILLTGQVEELPPELLESAGIGRVLLKPVTMHELGDAVHTALGRE